MLKGKPDVCPESPCWCPDQQFANLVFEHNWEGCLLTKIADKKKKKITPCSPRLALAKKIFAKSSLNSHFVVA